MLPISLKTLARFHSFYIYTHFSLLPLFLVAFDNKHVYVISIDETRAYSLETHLRNKFLYTYTHKHKPTLNYRNKHGKHIS